METATTSKSQVSTSDTTRVSNQRSISPFNSPIKPTLMETKTMQHKILLCCLALLFAFTVKAQSGLNCSSAVNISLNSSGVGQHLNAKQTAHDGWYKFTATKTNELVHAVMKQNGNAWTITNMNIYSGACSGLTTIGTAGLTGVTDSVLTIPLTNLTVGHTYYIELTRGTLNPCKTLACIPNDTAYVGIIFSLEPYIPHFG